MDHTEEGAKKSKEVCWSLIGCMMVHCESEEIIAQPS
jgi:hypothetical protein